MALLALLSPTPAPPPDALAPWRAKLGSASASPAVLVTCGDSLTDMDAASLSSPGWAPTLARMLAGDPGVTAHYYDVSETTWTVPWDDSPGLHVANIAASGATSYNYLTDARAEVIASTRPDIVTHMIGMNDSNFTSRTPAQVAEEILNRSGWIDTKAELLGYAAPVHAVMVEPRDASPKPEKPHDWWDRYSIEMANLVASESDRMVLADIDAAFGDDTGLRSSDDIHLTAAGYQRVADTMHELLTGTTHDPALAR